MKLALRLCRYVMSILCETDLGVVISHKTFINKIYERVYNGEGKECSLWINSSLFNINSPFVNSKSKSRKRGHHSLASESSVLLKEIEKVQSSLPIILAEAQKLGYLVEYISSSQEFKRNEEARKTADNFYQESVTWQGKFFHGGNNSDRAIIKCIENENYVIPAHCAFFSYNALDIVKKLDILKNKFDLILLDPPWWNKYIRRKKAKCAEGSYQMMYNEDLKKIPIESLLVPGSLIAVWCTNSPTHLNTLIDDIFPSWGVEYVAKWFWVKRSCHHT
ncbi:N(6)-adenine-specific methyltransferase METTL4 isoform X2 [Anabrus simplex]|uniref:N(6)-adenine-specific methyltransferase METTL4 isoform X2 n=1 Tax=Anabrus simplex TaxID=316456 RepID=UPI0035A271DA